MTPKRTEAQMRAASYRAPLAPGWGASLSTDPYAHTRVATPHVPVALSPLAKGVASRLLATLHSRARDSVWLPSMPEIAERMDITAKQLSSALGSLRGLGHIRTITGHSGPGGVAEWAVLLVETGAVHRTEGAPAEWVEKLRTEGVR